MPLAKRSPTALGLLVVPLLACSSSSTSNPDAGAVDTGLPYRSPADTGASPRDTGVARPHETGTTSTDADSTMSGWGCADNGTECLCYDPPPAGYTASSCGSYACCFAAEYSSGGAVEHECECVTMTPCTTTNGSATRVSSCPSE